MTYLNDIITKLSKIDIQEAAEFAILDTSKSLVEIQQEQLFQGFKSDGQPIVPPYAASTVSAKTRKGQPTDRVTLKDKGDFYKGILVDVRGDLFVLTSADEKTGKLEEKYTEKIFGLNEQSRMEYLHVFKPAFIKNIRRQIGY